MADMAAFHELIRWIATNRYFLLLAGMLVEGPLSTMTAGFTASFGATNLYLILILASLGNLIPDFFFFFLGLWGRNAMLVKYGGYIGIRYHSLERAERIIKKNARTYLVVVKLIPVLGSAGIAAAGSGRMKFRIFFPWATITGIALSSFLVFVGYYSGHLYRAEKSFLNILEFLLASAVIAIIIILFLRHDVAERILRKLEPCS